MKKVFGLIILLALIAGITYTFMASPGLARRTNDSVDVTASFYPMGEFARQVGGSHVNVTVLVKPGVEPHDYDPTPGDIARIHQSKLLVYNGAGLEPWAGKLRSELTKNGTVVVSASDGVTSGADPHVWLDPVLAAHQVDAIASALVRADPAHQADYRRNAQAYQRKLAALDQDYRTGLSQCSRHEIITSHQAIAYLSARYGFAAQGISGLSPDDEPSPQKLAEVARFARANNASYIFFETLANPKLSQTLASEVGAHTLVFNPLEGLTPAEIAQGKDYLTIQHENLENIRIALDCK